MKFSSSIFGTVALALLTVGTSQGAPALQPEARQLGGGWGSGIGYGWGRTWKDPVLVEPVDFDAIHRGGCSYDIVFRRDARDTKYLLDYNSVFGVGELETQRSIKPINLQWRGDVDSTGRRQYYAFAENACWNGTPPRVFKLYFTERQPSYDGYISPKFI